MIINSNLMNACSNLCFRLLDTLDSEIFKNYDYNFNVIIALIAIIIYATASKAEITFALLIIFLNLN